MSTSSNTTSTVSLPLSLTLCVTEVNKVRTVTVDGVGISADCSALLILHNDIGNSSDSHDWDEQPMLIRNVKVVKHLNETVPTPYVRLYMGEYPIKQFRTKNIYF